MGTRRSAAALHCTDEHQPAVDSHLYTLLWAHGSSVCTLAGQLLLLRLAGSWMRCKEREGEGRPYRSAARPPRPGSWSAGSPASENQSGVSREEARQGW
eukprot:SAG22_NODE_136_length_18095_cov_19.897255_15_plen_99_part_00